MINRILNDPRNIPNHFSKKDMSALTGLSINSNIPRYAILAVKDPLAHNDGDIADVIAESMTDIEQLSRSSMITVLKGKYGGTEMVVCSTGSGAGDTEIIMLDLMYYGKVDTFLRIGGSGTYDKDISPGDIVISSGAIRDEGMSEEFVQLSYPAFSSYEIVLPMVDAANKHDVKYYVGLTRSNDSIFCGHGKPFLGYVNPMMKNVDEYWNSIGVLNVDRETSAILTIAQLFGGRAGSVCTISNNQVTGEHAYGNAIANAISIGLEGIHILNGRDLEKKRRDVKYWGTDCC